MRLRTMTLAASLLLAALPCPAPSCILCSNIRQSASLRQEATSRNARLVLFGTLSNARLDGARPGSGKTDFTIAAVLKIDPGLPKEQQKRKGDVLVLPHYLPPPGAGAPAYYLVFCDVAEKRHDPYRSVAVSAAAAPYLRGALALPPRDLKRRLLYFFGYLDHADRELSQDAFMEFVKASDREVGEIAPHLPAGKLRGWLGSAKTPKERLGLYAFLLGSRGDKADVQWFETALSKPGERLTAAYDGLLSGYIRLRPQRGWDLATRILRDGKCSLAIRFAVVRTVRFYRAWRPAETRPQVLKALAALLAQGELADMAVEELRQWQMWDLTEAVLALYGRKGLDAPLIRRGIVRYALCCPLPRAKAFVAALRKQDGKLVEEVEEGVRLERQ